MAMWGRCRQQGRRYYHDKGIKVCPRWMIFENFLADMGERPPGLTIDRLDCSKDYEPGNCRWATWTEQCETRTKRFNRRGTIHGRKAHRIR
jgi:hypothetical protein